MLRQEGVRLSLVALVLESNGIFGLVPFGSLFLSLAYYVFQGFDEVIKVL